MIIIIFIILFFMQRPRGACLIDRLLQSCSHAL